MMTLIAESSNINERFFEKGMRFFRIPFFNFQKIYYICAEFEDKI